MSASEDVCAKQQANLDTFFDLLGHFSYDRAKEFLEKERDAGFKSHKVSQFFTTVLTAFCQLAAAEKNYSSFAYLVPKGFLRKDSPLKSMYESLRNEFQRLEDNRYITPVVTPTMSPTLSSRTPSPPSVTPSPSLSDTSESALSSLSLRSSVFGTILYGSPLSGPSFDILENLACHLCGQLLQFVSARLEMMEFYVRMCAMSGLKFMNVELLLDIISEISRKYQKLFHHPHLSALKSSFSYECEILIKLLECYVHMQCWKFLPSLLCLYEAHSKLGEWIPFSPKEGKKGAVSNPVRVPVVPALYSWLCSLKAALLSKFSFYFHEVLSKQTIPQEMKNLCSKTSVDYFQRITAFQKRYDAACVALVLDTNGLEGYRGHGYVHPNKSYEPPKGLNSYPAVVCSPPEKPISHWPGLVMIMDNEDKELKNSGSVVTFYDKRVNSTYFVASVEPRMTLVIIFDSKKSEKDTYITRFMLVLCSQLRCNKIFGSVKPGSK